MEAGASIGGELNFKFEVQIPVFGDILNSIVFHLCIAGSFWYSTPATIENGHSCNCL
jgi:hypothetical protein